MKKFRKSVLFLIITLVLLFSSIFEFGFSQSVRKLADNLNFSRTVIIKKYVLDSLAYADFVENQNIELKIEAYFKRKNSPLYKNAAKFVEIAKKYNLDPFFLPAITMIESSGGVVGSRATKNNNPFGWGSKRVKFKDFNQAIDTIGYKLSNLAWYKDKDINQKLSVYNQEDPNYKRKFHNFVKGFKKQKIDSIDYSQYLDSFRIVKIDTMILQNNVIKDLSF